MKKLNILIFLVSILVLITIPKIAHLSLGQEAKEFCEVQGYTYSDGMCIFDDGNSCIAFNFYAEMCGEEYVKILQCKIPGELDTPGTFCCSEFDRLTPYEIDADGNCNYMGAEVYYTCSDCGNGTCEEWENFCNCRADCRLPGDKELIEKVKGKILLQVEEKGEAWYVYPEDGQRYYMSDGFAAYGVMRTLGLGISNNNLNMIPIGILENDPTLIDNDSDGLDDKLEEAIGTNPNNDDSDNDGHSDNIEILSGFNPLGTGKISYNMELVESLKGKILLQVEGKGEAWYVNMNDKKRYYLKDGETAYQIMSDFGLGISNKNIWPIARGSIFVPFHNKLNTLLVNDKYYISIPYGWSYLMPGNSGQDIKLSNTSLREMLYHWTDNYGSEMGTKIHISLRTYNYGDSEFADQLLTERIERIKNCEDGVIKTLTLDNLDFTQCTSKYYGYGAIRQISETEYLYIQGSYSRYKSQEYSYESETETIEKILSTIDFIE